MKRVGLKPNVMIDFSHANSSKVPERQVEVCSDVAGQIAQGNSCIMGVMIESHLVSGRQEAHSSKELVYGQSITDACIGWDDTKPLLLELAAAVSQRRQEQPATMVC